MATLQLYGKGGLIFQLEFSRTMDAKSKSLSCLSSNVKSSWPMKRAKLTCMHIGENVHEDIVRKAMSYTPVGACDITIMNLAKNVHEYISRHLVFSRNCLLLLIVFFLSD